MIRYFLVFMLAVPCASFAEVYPKRTDYDRRIQYVDYNADDVTIVRTKLGNVTTIQLAEDEHLESPESALAIGDKSAWSIAVRRNNIILKPIAEFPQTNINIMTNKRSYALQLVESKSDRVVSFFVRYKYPEVEAQLAKVRAEQNKKPFPLCSDGPRNYSYMKYGDNELSPTLVWDDGKFTCFKYPNNKPLPAIYKSMPNSELKEALVNFNVIDDTIVVQEVHDEFRLRLGKQVLGIKTDNIDNIPYNRNKTANGTKRGVIRNDR